MADLPSIEDKINDLEVGGDKVLSEILQRRYGTNINSLIDKTDTANSDIAANTAAIAALSTANVQKSSSCGTFSRSSSDPEAQVTNFSVAITPSRTGVVRIYFESADSQLGGLNGDGVSFFRIKKNGGTVHTFNLLGATGGNAREHLLEFIDTSAGTSAATYTVTMETTGVGKSNSLIEMVMVCQEVF